MLPYIESLILNFNKINTNKKFRNFLYKVLLVDKKIDVFGILIFFFKK